MEDRPDFQNALAHVLGERHGSDEDAKRKADVA